jgi:hypothetical protein
MRRHNKYFIELVAFVKSFAIKGENESFSTIVFVECELKGNEDAMFFFTLVENAKDQLRKSNQRIMPENINVRNIWLMDSGIYLSPEMKKV